MSKAPQHDTIHAALLAAQAEMPVVKRDAANPHFKSKYASLQAFTEAALPILHKHGLSWTVTTDPPNGHGFVVFVGTLANAAGEDIEYRLPMQPDSAKPQAMGSAITYARRYLLGMVTGVATEDDDDGNAASGTGKAKPTSRAPLVQEGPEAGLPKYDSVPPAFNSKPSPWTPHIPREEWEAVAKDWHSGARANDAALRKLFAVAGDSGWRDALKPVLEHHFGITTSRDWPSGKPLTALLRVLENYAPAEPQNMEEDDDG